MSPAILRNAGLAKSAFFTTTEYGIAAGIPAMLVGSASGGAAFGDYAFEQGW